MAVISSHLPAAPHKASTSAERAVRLRRRMRLQQQAWRGALAALLMLGDMIAINVGWIGVYLQQSASLRAGGLVLPTDPDAIQAFMLLFDAIWLVAFLGGGLYSLQRGASRIDEAYKVVASASLATVLALMLNALLAQAGIQRIPWTAMLLALGWLAAVSGVIFWRLIYRRIVLTLRMHGIDTRRLLIVGGGEPGVAVWRAIRRTPELGYRVQGFLSDRHTPGALIDDLPVLGRPIQLSRIIRITRADEIIIALTGRTQHELMDIVALAEDETVTIRVYPDTFQLMTSNEVTIGDVSGLPLVSIRNVALDSPWNRALKRALDVVFSLLLLVTLSPLMLLVALLIKFDSRGPIFFLQERVGMDNEPFWMIKFRTMTTASEVHGPGWTIPNDPRVTRVGAFLRKTSIDELPQFINVLMGTMSVVGPRPEQRKWVEQFSRQIPRYMRRHKEKAGITGWAQVNGLRGDTSIAERTRYDLYYIENWSLLFDIKIILKTIVDMLTGRQQNAY